MVSNMLKPFKNRGAKALNASRLILTARRRKLKKILTLTTISLLLILTFPIIVSKVKAEPQRTITFSDYEWIIKSSETAKAGPGPNYWSDKNVWVDENGWLHLKITYKDERGYCAEVYTKERLGYGTYVFYIASRIDILDRNVVLGLFAYKDDEHEVDIEFSKWGNGDAKNAWFTVQPSPYVEGHNQKSFDIRLMDTYSTHWFTWSRNYVFFESFYGHYSYEAPPRHNIILSWVCPLKRQADEARAHINLWLLKGFPPSDGKEVEVIIKEFRFYPNMRSPRLPELNVYGYVKDDLGNSLGNSSVTVKSPIDQASATTDSQGRYAATLSVNGPGDRIQVTATFGSKSGSASGTVPSGSSSMQIDVTVPRILTSIFYLLLLLTGLILGIAIGTLTIIRMRKKRNKSLAAC
ncbi:MAG: hypothetical protein FGF51_00410 [Candidatus Brockarchaeota archaeon]|nr:hypothetical protein [Candidatus Brockarchaeota archaeon]